jgi:hypothetical protein
MACRCPKTLTVMVMIAAAGCTLRLGHEDGYGPWLGSLVAPIAIFDAEVVDTGSVDVTLRGADGAALRVEPHPTVTVDDVQVLEHFAANPFEQELYERLSAMASASTPIEILNDDDVKFEPGRRYRITLRHSPWPDPARDIDLSAQLAWDLADDRPADGESAGGWRGDLDALRSAGLVEGSNADAVVAIAQAFSSATPTDTQHDIMVTLLGESMVHSPVQSTPPTSAP